MKSALVLEGGASRAIFSSGVMDCFLDNNINLDYIIGVSAGITNGMSYASKQKGRALKIAVDYSCDKRYMGIKHLLNPKTKCYYNLDFVFNHIPNVLIPYDHETYSKSASAIAGVTNIETGECEYKPVPPYENSWKTLIASCALPILFKPVDLDGSLYLDGGISDPVPVDKAIKEGCDKVIVITTREKSYTKDKDMGAALSGVLYRKHSRLSYLLKNRARLYNESRTHLKELEEEGRIFWIAPSDTSTWGRTDSSPEKIKAMYQEGYETAQKLLPDILKYLGY